VKRYYIFPLILLVFGCGKQPKQAIQQEDAPVKSVKYVVSEYQNFQQVRQFGGEVKSATTSPLSFKVSGTIEDIAIKKGQVIEKGQLIASLEKEEFQLSLDKAKASLGSSYAAYFQANDQYERAQKLKEKGFVSDSELLTIKAELDAKQQQMKLAQSDVNNAVLSLSRTELHAPFSGLVSAVYLDSYTKVSSGTTVVELISSNTYQVDFLVPESLIGEVSFGDELKVTIPALENTQLTGVVSEIGAVVEKGNAYSVTLLLNEAHKVLRNGMTANVDFTIGNQREKVVLLPINAFNFNDTYANHPNQNAAIYIINEQSKLEKRYVEVRRNINSQVVVLSNLTAGEKVVVAGVPYLFEGQQVTLWKGI